MQESYTRTPKVIYMSPDKLEDYIHNEAIVGDILKSFSYESGTYKDYIYVCTENNIGKDVKPYWTVLG